MVDRIKQIMDIYGLTPAGFADTIGVQRSGMSHILNGRNKPSLDFVVKTLQHFPRINPDWLLSGEGVIYRTDKSLKNRSMPAEPTIFDVISAQSEELDEPDELDIQEDPIAETRFSEPSPPSVLTDTLKDQPLVRDEEAAVYHTERSKKAEPKVDQVIIFYADLSCTVYRPNPEKK